MHKPSNTSLPRRNLLRNASVALASAALPATATAENLPRWTLEQGESLFEHPYGIPSPFEKAVVRRPRETLPFPTSTLTPLRELEGIITPNGLHYIRDHAGTPIIDPEQHRLVIHGMVDRPLSFAMNDLMRFPSVSRIHFLECSGNIPLNKTAAIKPNWTVQDTHGLLSCAEWTGVHLSDLLAEAGVQPGATWFLAEGADAAALTRSIPLEKAMDDAILAWAQNGERLRPEQGYPLRLLLPGYEGNTNVKWLRRIKLGDQPFQTREETSKYTSLQADGTALQFNFVINAKSVITRPSPGPLLAPGFHEITGLAWSGRGRITRLEVSTDGGASWSDAALQEPVMTKCLTRFRLPWTWDGSPATLQSRATDETGNVQPTRAAFLGQRGPNSMYHYNAIVGWRLAPGGELTLAA